MPSIFVMKTMFFDHVWGKATEVLFLKGRLYFHKADGTKASANAGAPSCLVGYGEQGLAECGIPGYTVRIKPRIVEAP